MARPTIKRSNTVVDMTAMCDVAFILLTFFITAANFKAEDAVAIEIPSSISGIKVPENDIMIISLDQEGKVYFGVDDQRVRLAMLDNMAQAKGMSFTEKEKKVFSLLANFGVPINQLKSFLSLPDPDRNKVRQPGIPVDSTGAGASNELKDWVFNARTANNKLRIAFKGDNDATFPNFKSVLATLQAQNINKFNLITASEAPPAGWRTD